jgi:hypothetical protein
MMRAITVIALALAAVLIASPAVFASVAHRFEGTFNGSEGPEGPFFVIYSDAVDNSAGASTGDIYVAEFGVIEKLHADGTYAGLRFTGAETPDGSFGLFSETGRVGRITVDSSAGPNAGDLYVADIEHGVIDKFDEAGKFICQITGRSEPSATECASSAGSGTPGGSINPTGLAVDPTSGDLWAADAAHDVIDKFNAAGEYVGQTADTHITTPGAIALDTAGHLYVVNEGPLFSGATGGNVVVFHNGAFERTFDTAEPAGLAVDRSNNHVYVFDVRGSSGGTISEYDAAGSLLDEFGGGGEGGAAPIGDAESIAVSSDGHVFAAQIQEGALGAKVYRFSPDVIVPTVTTGAATSPTETAVTLTGHVDPDAASGGGPVTACTFEYVSQELFESNQANLVSPFEGAAQAPCIPATPYAGGQDVSATVTGLSPSTTYRYRLTAKNASEILSVGATAQTATVGPPLVTKETSFTTSVNGTTLKAVVTPAGFQTGCTVQYVDATHFDASGYASATTVPCTPASLPPTSTGEAVSVKLSGLAISTIYHYRFVAQNSAGTTYGVDETLATFGIKSFAFEALDKEGHPYTQAGGHPYEWTTRLALNTTTGAINHGQLEAAVVNFRNVETELPAGLIANPTATVRCPRAQLAVDQCTSGSQVGELEVTGIDTVYTVGLYNVVPPAGTPVELGAVVANLVRVYIDGNVRTGGDYGATARVVNASAENNIYKTRVTIWGVPEDPSHNGRRVCPVPGIQVEVGEAECPPAGPAVPFLTNPTSCPGTPLVVKARVDSWQAPGLFVSAESDMPATTGCEWLDFTPSLSLAPDTSVADSPSGLNLDIGVPQNETAAGLSSSALKDATVRLPEGVSVSPSAANGLEACSEAQIGLHSEAAAGCPNGSKIGTVDITTPLLAHHLTGGVYVARQGENPFHSLLALYIAAEADGARVKLAGHVVADPVTGQLTTTFDENPDLPFSDLKLNLFGGRRGALATPESCGTFTSNASLAPWDGLPATGFTPSFTISSGCVSGFKPSFSAGVTHVQAASHTTFALSLARSDTDEELSGLSVKLPPGLLAKIAGVPLCSEPEAAAGSCPSSSQIGTVETSSGPGPSPLALPGRIYLTGPYKGAPYGEEVVVPAIAGPFNLGDVVVRGTIQIDPVTAQATVTSDPFPKVIQGIPVRLRRVDVSVDRPGFVLNPTSCEALAVAASITSGRGTIRTATTPFRVANCATLKFTPKFSVSTNAKTSKALGASLTTKIAEPAGSLGSQANISKVKVELPKQLPSQLKTLQKACLDRVFNANPAGCPPESIVGHATVHTPLLPLPLTGPAYFVSHGNEAFPSLTMVLQGNGITVQLVGSTFISKSGITSSTFKTVPDVPFETFELTLPQGKFSALAAHLPDSAHGSLCGQSLKMPTELVAQNGAVIKQSTLVAPEGCPNKLTILFHRVKKRTLTLKIAVPSAGRLTATGRGLIKAFTTAKGRSILTLTLKAKGRHKLNTKVKLTFAPTQGKKLTAAIAAKFKL